MQYGFTLTQLAKYSSNIFITTLEPKSEINPDKFYKSFCAAQDFENLLDDTDSFTRTEATDYCEWKMRMHGVQRSSTPLFGSEEAELSIVPFEKEDAALLMLMGRELLAENSSINMNKSIEEVDYNEWEMRMHEVQRSSTPLFGSRESENLIVPFEKEDAALFMLMGHKIMEPEY